MDLEIARGYAQLCNTIVHFPAKIVIQAGVLETWTIDAVNMNSLKELIQISPWVCLTLAHQFQAQLVSAVLSTTECLSKCSRYVFALRPRNLGQ